MSLLDVHVGAIGFEHPDWASEFYPEDLPEDWRLEFYANAHETLLLPVDRLLAAPAHELESWVDDTGDEFRLFLLCRADSAAGEYEALAANARALGEKLSGVLLDGTDPALLARAAASCSQALPHAVVLGPALGSGAQRGPVYWTPGAQGVVGAGLAVGCIDREVSGLPALRDILRGFIDWCGERDDAWLFFGGSPPKCKMISDAGVMLDLLIG